jgi:hypothetical protein
VEIGHVKEKPDAGNLVVREDREDRVTLTRGIGAPGCGVIANDFAFRGISAANELSEFRDHGPGGGAVGTNRTERARAWRESGA